MRKNDRKRRLGGPPGHEWYSICSMHYDYDETCNCCNTGMWQSTRKLFWENLLYKIWPWAWGKWVNRKNSPERKFVEDTFPNLKND